MAEIAYIQITRTCNQNCRFCSNPSTGSVMSLKFAKRLIDRYVRNKYAGVIISGGEPTTHPKLAEILAYAGMKNLPSRIITNGQLTSDRRYLNSLVGSGLDHMGVSVYSSDSRMQAFLTGNKPSLTNIRKTLENAGKIGVRTDIHTTINHYNAGSLSKIITWIIRAYPFVRHFIYNNLDPLMNRAAGNPDTIPRLGEFELELYKSMKILDDSGRTFRVERVPLCCMADYAHCSTETRKIVKSEKRTIYFLDEKQLKIQDRNCWKYGKTQRCGVCSVKSICAGLYQMGKYYRADELCPVFVSKKKIIERIRQ